MDERSERILAAVDLLAPAFEGSGLEEMEVAVGELRVRLARPAAPPSVLAAAATTAAETAPTATPRPTATGTPFGEPPAGRHHVTAPLTGVWYAAPSPGARSYVTEGAEVATGQVIGLIEAMKLFNEIKADASGTITRVLVESGTLVKRTQPLMEIEPS